MKLFSNDDIRKFFVIDVSNFYVYNENATLRSTAKIFNVSKSTMNKMIKHELKHINISLYKQARYKSKNNFSEKYIRGGLATKRKFKQLKEYGQYGNCKEEQI